MNEDKGLSPVILEIAALSAAVASRCPSKTAEMAERLGEYGVPDHHVREVVAIARRVATESWERAAGMIDAVIEGERPADCLPHGAPGAGACGTDHGEGCCGEPTNKTTCC